MHKIFNYPETVFLVLFSLLFIACSSPTKVNETYIPSTDLYSQPIDENAILQDEESGMVFAGDQVLVLTKDVLVGKEVLDTIAAEYEIELVGAPCALLCSIFESTRWRSILDSTRRYFLVNTYGGISCRCNKINQPKIEAFRNKNDHNKFRKERTRISRRSHA